MTHLHHLTVKILTYIYMGPDLVRIIRIWTEPLATKLASLLEVRPYTDS